MTGRSDPNDLYGLPLAEFVPQRDALARRLRESGDREAAAAVKALRKPTVAAWAMNQLARRRRDAVAQLLDVGDRLLRAQEAALGGGGAAALRDLGRERRDVVAALVDAALDILAEAGLGSQAQRDRIAAALSESAVDRTARDLLQRGCLTVEPAPAGFGEMVEAAAAPVGHASGIDERIEVLNRRADDAEREAQRLAAEARRAASEAERAAEDAEHAARRAEQATERARSAEQAAADAERAAAAARAEADHAARGSRSRRGG